MDNSVFDIAQVKTKKLKFILLDKNCEELAFPSLFPNGKFGFSCKASELSWSNILTDDYLITLKGLHQTLIICFSVKKFYN